MSGNHAGNGAHGAGGAVNAQALQLLAGSGTGPYGFGEFERRVARRAARRRVLRQGLATSLATVGVAVLAAIAVLQSRPLAQGRPTPELVYDNDYLPAAEPAVVDVGRFAVREALADRIALLDLQLTEGRAYVMPEEELRQLAATREQLEQSLRSVSYAHALMTF